MNFCYIVTSSLNGIFSFDTGLDILWCLGTSSRYPCRCVCKRVCLCVSLYRLYCRCCLSFRCVRWFGYGCSLWVQLFALRMPMYPQKGVKYFFIAFPTTFLLLYFFIRIFSLVDFLHLFHFFHWDFFDNLCIRSNSNISGRNCKNNNGSGKMERKKLIILF